VPNGDLAAFKAAVVAANATAAPDTIMLAKKGDYVFTDYYPTADPLDRTALPTITTSITIEGNGSRIRRGNSQKIPPGFRLFRVAAGGTLRLRAAAVENGYGIWGESNGSGVRNDGGSLTVERCRFEGNENDHWAAAILTTGPTTVRDSIFTQNATWDAGTGAIRASDTSSLTIERCQFSGNYGDTSIFISNIAQAQILQCSIWQGGSLDGKGGDAHIRVDDSVLRLANCTITEGPAWGVLIQGSTVTVTHCTITLHSSNIPGMGIYLTSGTLSLRNSILAFNNNGIPGSADCKVAPGAKIHQNVRNLIADGSCSPYITGDPKLGSLGYYGGETLVYPLVVGSPAIDKADDQYSETTDQRGVARPQGAHSDLGAYEGYIWDLPPLQLQVQYKPVPYFIVCDPAGPNPPWQGFVLGTRALDVRTIDTSSLTLGNAPPGSVRVRGVRDINRDGIPDLSLEFRLTDVYRGVTSCDAVSLLELQGLTRQGQHISGYVKVTPKTR
jgi:hypothetical protein